MNSRRLCCAHRRTSRPGDGPPTAKRQSTAKKLRRLVPNLVGREGAAVKELSETRKSTFLRVPHNADKPQRLRRLVRASHGWANTINSSVNGAILRYGLHSLDAAGRSSPNTTIQTEADPARAPTSQFPTLLRRTAHLPDRNVDAIHRSGVAGVSAHRIRSSSGLSRICRPDSCFSVRSGRWDSR
jgi:hypothetical protein